MLRTIRNLLKKRLKVICFDLDGTLYDFGSAEAESEAYIAGVIAKDIRAVMSRYKMNSRVREQDILRVFNEVKNRSMHIGYDIANFSRANWIRETLLELGQKECVGVPLLRIEDKCSVYERHYWDFLEKRIKKFPDSITLLEHLRKSGFRIAAITDSDGRPGMKLMRIRSMGLTKYFDHIITSDDTGLAKPAVENWSMLLKIFSASPSECMMIGDHPEIDLATAKKLGFITVWNKQFLNTDLHWNYVDYEIHDIKEVENIMKKLS